MKKSTAVKLALSSLLLAGTVVGCKPMGGDRPMAVSAVAPVRASGKAAAFAAQAEHALAAHKPTLAVTKAEAAVALAPRDAGERLLLGRSYLAAGRFLSAEAAFQDAATLDPADARVPLKLALAQIALGKWSEARTTLGDAKGKVAEPDRGLALALAGQPEAAIAVLEPAAREAGATVKTRQNLALAYALAGRWADSRAVAAQDMAPEYVNVRMQEWVQFAQPHAVSQQVAALLGVTPVTDPGQPAALALAPTDAAVQTAALVPAGASPAQAASGAAAPFAAAAAEAAPETEPALAAATPDSVFFAAPSAGREAPTLRPARTPMKQPLAAHTRNLAPGHARSASRDATPPAASRKPAFAMQREQGGWAVQIGAFASPTLLETAWTRTSGRLTMLAGYAPSRSEHANMHRLALTGFGSRGAAQAMCVKIHAKGGACFVRRVAGDTPVQTAARKPSIVPPTRFASR